MIFLQKWFGAAVDKEAVGEFFPAVVPGNIQEDYGRAHGFGDVNYADNCKLYEPLEDLGWIYRTELQYERKTDERVFFVTKGIEYEYEVRMNSKLLKRHTGMFSSVEIDITDELEHGDLMEIYIYPHPKREGAEPCRQQADQSCKPAVEYGWDWHPRLLVSGLWNDTYIETRGKAHIRSCEASYILDGDMRGATVSFDIDADCDPVFELYDPEGVCVYRGAEKEIHLDDIKLWWCAGQGEPSLYLWNAVSDTDMKSGYIGFRKVRLVMNGGAWDKPSDFPKTRSTPPVTVELNGRRIFAKGSNWVNPELFTGRLSEEIYERHLELVKEANMNMVRLWGGAVVNKDIFYELCDKKGIMVWQEFPLACNNYEGTKEYLEVLEQEASAIIRRLRAHACLTLWCGGNELFNSWSGMTDQSLALRLLNKLCYELNRDTPFIMTAPLMGMGHGYYAFMELKTGRTVFEMFRDSSCTAYSEFGVSSIARLTTLKKAIPEDILYSPKPASPWETHNGYGAWEDAGEDSWLCLSIIDAVFGKQETLEDYIDKSTWLQSEGMKFIFEEARRQKPVCSMAVNWCFNEPWINAAGPNIVSYPAEPKEAYFAVRDSLRDIVPSAAVTSFRNKGGSVFSAELWMLNDSPEDIFATVSVYLETDGNKEHILDWDTGTVPAGTNKKGPAVETALPKTDRPREFSLILEANGIVNRYRLPLEPQDGNDLR